MYLEFIKTNFNPDQDELKLLEDAIPIYEELISEGTNFIQVCILLNNLDNHTIK